MRVLSLSLAATLACVPAAAQGPSSYSGLVIFGDSLSDNGNLFRMIGQPAAPYWNGRFSNGPVWAEQLAESLELGPTAVENRAVGGSATTDVLNAQVIPWLIAHGATADPHALYVVWAGSNDLLDVLAGGGDPGAAIEGAITNTAQAVVALALAGAHYVVVPSLPDLSLTPRAQAAGAAAVAGARALTDAYNHALAGAMAAVEGMVAVDVVEIDTAGLLRDIVAEPRRYRLWNTVDPALRTDGSVVCFPDRHLFWDDIHPTKVGHAAIRDEVLRGLGVPLFGDVDGDGWVDVRDVRALVRAFGPCAPGCRADLDRDGDVDRRDLHALFSLLAA